MGLDTYAYVDKEPMADTLFPESCVHLCGGMFSGGGSSFRGKVYNGFIEAISGVSLYTEKMSSEDLDTVVASLKNILGDLSTDDYATDYLQSHCITIAEAKALYAWFSTVKEHNGFVVGWW
jgi:hypothetical protein